MGEVIIVRKDVVKEYGFPAAMVLWMIETDLNSEDKSDSRFSRGWVRRSTKELHQMAGGTLGFSTISLAIADLAKAGLIEIGRNKGEKKEWGGTNWFRIPKKGRKR